MKQTILTNPTEAELAAAVHENLYALFRSMQILVHRGEELAGDIEGGSNE